MNYPPFGLRLRPYRPPLRVSPEQGAKHRVEACKKANMLFCRRLFTKPQNSWIMRANSLRGAASTLSPSCRLYPPGRSPLRGGVEPEAGPPRAFLRLRSGPAHLRRTPSSASWFFLFHLRWCRSDGSAARVHPTSSLDIDFCRINLA